METPPRSASHAAHAPSEPGLERLRRDLQQIPPDPDGAAPEPEATDADPRTIDYAAMEFELDRLRKRLAIWEIFMAYVRDGARTWTDVQRAMTPRDLEQITAICDGVPLRDVLLHLR